MIQLQLADPAATDALGQLLARTQPATAVVHLHGDLGAGKSSLARAWLRALGVVGAIRSPTYTLVEHYPYADARLPQGGKALHLDLYRIGGPGELEFLALDDAAATLWLVEWPERGGDALPQADLRIGLSVAPAGGRAASLQAGTPAGDDWVRRMPETPAYRALLTSTGRNIRQVTDL
ncbi:MAG: tRNA (adenosine(37)-N6)-threonylcarbamoyltransferase complex ATPase subunit type 1 TsaE [Lysobacter sp.]|nr:tRNA (adenosine(37)-N6)-threonylcarbamoyltransferase complex ATPase subunit type 1 TsaE [Lysobacter sp.]